MLHHFRELRLIRLLVVCGAVCICVGAVAQTTATPAQTKLGLQSFPSVLGSNVVALGDRLTKPGKERMVLTGTFSGPAQSTPATLTFQWPSQFRFAASASRSLGSDGSNYWASDNNLSEQDEDLLESFIDDSADGLLSDLRQSRSMRLVATRVRMDTGATPNYAGPWSDVYQVSGVVQSRSAKPVRSKLYYFDWKTRLLVEVDYLQKRADGSIISVQVKQSNWTSVGGQLVPGTVVRYENGKSVFTFTASNAAFAAAATDSTFLSGH